MSRRTGASLLALALAFLPAACLCAPAPAHAVETPAAPAPPCHGGGHERAPAAPEHDAACSHCHVAANLPAADQGGALAAAFAVGLVQPVVIASAGLVPVARVTPRVPHPPADARRQRSRVLLI